MRWSGLLDRLTASLLLWRTLLTLRRLQLHCYCGYLPRNTFHCSVNLLCGGDDYASSKGSQIPEYAPAPHLKQHPGQTESSLVCQVHAQSMFRMLSCHVAELNKAGMGSSPATGEVVLCKSP